MRYELNYISTDYPDYFQGCPDPCIAVSVHEKPTIKSITKAIKESFEDQALDQIPDEASLSWRQCQLIAPILLGVWKRWLEDRENEQKLYHRSDDIPWTYLKMIPMQGKIKL